MYTLRYPIKLAEPYEIGASNAGRLTFDGLSIELLHEAGYHVFIVSGLESAEAAVDFGRRLWVALSWAMLDRSTAFRVNGEPRIEKLFDAPERIGENLASSLGLEGPVDAIIDTAFPTVYPTDARLRKVTGGSVGVSVSMPFDRFSPDLAEGLGVATNDALPPRLRTAIDLFHSHHFEASAPARLFTLVMAMEVLAEGREKHPVAIEMLDSWRDEVHARRNAETDAEADFALESLEREIIFRRDDSLRGRVRRMTLEALAMESEEARAERGRTAVAIYDRRSELAHEGYLPPDVLSSTLSDARELVAQILRQLIRGAGTA